MPARLHTRHKTGVIERIKAGALIDLLQDNAFGLLRNNKGKSYELSKGRIVSAVKALEYALGKPDQKIGLEATLTLTQLIQQAANPQAAVPPSGTESNDP